MRSVLSVGTIVAYASLAACSTSDQGTELRQIPAEQPVPRPSPLAAALNLSIDVDKIMPGIKQNLDAAAVRPQAPPIGPAVGARSQLESFVNSNLKITFDDVLASKPVASRQSFSEMKTYFQNLYKNSTPTHSFTVGTQKFDCIPIRQQPSLRNSPDPIDTPPEKDNAAAGHTILGYSDYSCSTGEIPLKETPLSEIANYQTLRDYLSKDKGLSRRLTNEQYKFQVPTPNALPQIGKPQNEETPSNDGYVHRYAVMYQSTRLNGVDAQLNLWSPQISGTDMSLSQTWIVSGSGSETETLESGWQVRDGLEKNIAVPFVYSTQDNYSNTGCYNLDCAGFVQTTNQVIFARFPDDGYSVAGFAQKTLNIRWERKDGTGNWWVRMNDIWVGYYPAKLYKGDLLGAKNAPVTAEFGGENTGQAPAVQMGSGVFSSKGYGRAAFQSGLSILSSPGTWVDVIGLPYVTNPNCYSLTTTEASRPLGTRGPYFYFGGPGLSDPGCAASQTAS